MFDRAQRLRRIYHAVLLLEVFAFLVAAFFLLVFIQPLPLETLFAEHRAQTFFTSWLAMEQAGLFGGVGLSALAFGLSLELTRRILPADELGGWG